VKCLPAATAAGHSTRQPPRPAAPRTPHQLLAAFFLSEHLRVEGTASVLRRRPWTEVKWKAGARQTPEGVVVFRGEAAGEVRRQYAGEGAAAAAGE